jgi:hypothetical protein
VQTSVSLACGGILAKTVLQSISTAPSVEVPISCLFEVLCQIEVLRNSTTFLKCPIYEGATRTSSTKDRDLLAASYYGRTEAVEAGLFFQPSLQKRLFLQERASARRNVSCCLNLLPKLLEWQQVQVRFADRSRCLPSAKRP